MPLVDQRALVFLAALLGSSVAHGAQADTVKCTIFLGTVPSTSETFVLPSGRESGTGKLFLQSHQYSAHVKILATPDEVEVEMSLQLDGEEPSISSEYGYARLAAAPGSGKSDYVDVRVARLQCEVL
jgi:hypothetical protein